MNYTYNYDVNGFDGSGLAAIGAGTWIITIIVAIATLVGIWKVYEKAGKPGWAAIIPYYNNYVLFEIAGYNGWMFLLLLVPFVNIVFYFLVNINIAKKFGKGTGFGLVLVFFPVIGYLILGFNGDNYTA